MAVRAQIVAMRSEVETIDEPLGPDLARRVIGRVRAEGFAVLQSRPSALDPEALRKRADELLEFGTALGTPLVQSPRRELVEDVKDYSDVDPTNDDRGYRSGGELSPHSDPPTLIVLHCIQPAKEGGESSLVKVSAIVDRMMETRPDLVNELFRPLPDWRVPGQYGIPEAGPTDPRPILARYYGVLSCVLYRPFVEKAAEALDKPLTHAQQEALDLFEQCSMAEDLTIRFTLQPGQTMVLHNRRVLHARTNYVDWPEMHRRRHLLRMWIDAPSAFPVHPEHELGDFFAPRKAPR
jgi:Taurine catabolism dioxygenase TauD, TfdA family